MTLIDEITVVIDNARNEADYWITRGRDDNVNINLTTEQCDALSELLLDAHSVIVTGATGRGVSLRVDDLLLLSGAFKGDPI